MTQIENSRKPAPHTLRRRLALSTALASLAFASYGARGAYAGSCTPVGGTYECSGAANDGVDVTQILSGTPLDVTTVTSVPEPVFGIDTTTTGGNAFTLTGTGGLTFTDLNNSAITGADHGIFAENDGGSLTITTNGVTTGNTFEGIEARNSSNGDALSITTGVVNGGANGIYGYNRGEGALTITANGHVSGGTAGGYSGHGIRARNERDYGSDVTPTDLTVNATSVSTAATFGDGISADNYGTGFLTINATGPVTGNDDGINANNEGNGALSITALGTVTGVNDDGITAQNDGTDLTISAAAVFGDDDGINADNFGTGALSITATGTVTGGDDAGIDATNSDDGTSLTIVAAEVNGLEYGIFANNDGTGALSITATGQVTGTDYYGINAENRGTSLTINAAGVSGGDDGIRAYNYGSGSLSITASDLVTSGSDEGIDAYNSEDGTNLTISAAAVTGQDYGIYANNEGTGTLSITATGQVTATDNDGIDAENDGTSLTIIAAGVSGGDDGINADNYGSGALSVTATGLVTGATEEGIDAYNSGDGTDLTINAASVTGENAGIMAENRGTGDLSITATGQVTATEGHGVYALNDDGDDTMVSVAGVSGTEDGVFVRNSFAGDASVTVSGIVSGGTGHGIRTETGEGDLTTIALNSGAAVSSASGVAISNDVGDSDTTVNAGASVTGAIQLGDGSDNLTFDGGSFAGVTTFDGGDDTSTADSFTDRLAFKNVSGSVAGASIVNWERVTVDMNGTISFSDNALTAGTLEAVNGGRISMETGAAESFALDGQFELNDGGVLALEFFTPLDFDTIDITGGARFGALAEIDVLFDAGFDPFDDLELTFLTSDGIAGFGNLLFNFIGLDPLFTASVGLSAGEDELFLRFSGPDSPTAVSEPGVLALFGTGLLGLLGMGRRRHISRQSVGNLYNGADRVKTAAESI